MPNKNYLRGRRLEWQVKKDLEAEGWIALRTAGSHGHWDVIAFKDTGHSILTRLIQCKVTNSEKQLERLVKEFKANAPLGHYQRSHNSCAPVQQQLVVKLTGLKQYLVYPLES